jgi:multicomponent Na+:H+ antiporter subunit B
MSLILQTATRYLMPLLLLFSIFLLLRGHNKPGGGFSGGLVAAAAFALYAVAFDVAAARRLVRVSPHVLIGIGLLIAIASGVASLFAGASFMTGMWNEFYLPLIGSINIGTPIFFDIGVYLVVIGVTLVDVFTLAEESSEPAEAERMKGGLG